MDNLQGGDWSSFFHQFEAVASQSTTNVSRPSIVDDNVPLPIILAGGHHFDIAYQETVDEHVKCQVCGMLLRRTMFAAHVRQRHPEMCPPSLSTDDDSGRHSGLESPDISRNPNFPFSPKLMSPPIPKEPIKLTISLKGHRKHKRRKTKRERRGEEATVSSMEDEHSPDAHGSKNEDRFFWPDDEQPGPSSQTSTPNFLGHGLSPSGRLKAPESPESIEDVVMHTSPRTHTRPRQEASSDEDTKKRRKRKSKRKTRRKERDNSTTPVTPRSRVLPAVEPLRLAITPEGARVIETPRDRRSPAATCRQASQTERNRPETRSFTHSQQTSSRSAFTEIQSFPASSHILPTPQSFSHLNAQPASTSGTACEAKEGRIKTLTVGQPARKAGRGDAVESLLPQSPPVATVLTPSSWVYSQSQITTEIPILPTYNTRSVRKAAVESASFRPEAIAFDPFVKPSALMEPEGVRPAVSDSAFLEEAADPHSTENRRPILPQRKTRQPSGSQEASWEPLGIKSPTYGVVLPVAPRQDNDADDATVAFLTSSPELLSEDDSCPIKEEVEDAQSMIGASPSRLYRQKVRSVLSATSESTDTDQRTIIDVEEDQAERRSSDRDSEIRSLTKKLAALSQEQLEQRKLSVDISRTVSENVNESTVTVLEASPVLHVETVETTLPYIPSQRKEVEILDEQQEREELVFTPDDQHIPVLDGTFDAIFGSAPSEYSHSELSREVLEHSAIDQASLERIYEENVEEQEQFVPSQQLAASVGGLSIGSEKSEMPINVLVTSRREGKDVSVVASDQERTLSPVSLIGSRAKLVSYREEEEMSSYGEDYSADDDELVDLHESSISNYHELEQQTEYEQSLRQQPPSSVTPTEEPAFSTNDNVDETSHQINVQDASQILWDTGPTWPFHTGSAELRVQTAFEGPSTSQHVLQHSEPLPQRLASQRPSIPAAFNFGAAPAVPAQQIQQPPPHSFPLQGGQGQKLDSQQWSQPYSVATSQNTNVQGREVVFAGSDQQQLSLDQGQRKIRFYSEQTQFQPYKPRQNVVSGITQSYTQPEVFSFTQSQHPYELQPQQPTPTEQASHWLPSASSSTLERRPAELMEAEMKAMRYIYLMNEQRHAKKTLAEQDEKMPRISEEKTTNLMLLTELPPIIIEPTVIPEGVSRFRMQEHTLPPYHHAHLTTGSGPPVSPLTSEGDNSSDEEIRKLHDVLDFTLLESSLPSKVPRSDQQSFNKQQQFQAPRLAEESRQQHPSGGSHRSLPSLNILQVEAAPITSVALEVALPQNIQAPELVEVITDDVAPVSGRSFISEGDVELSGEDCNARKGEQASERESSPESTDSDAIRRQWDLSPSVSPLTLEALASGMSSPDGSDSNDGQTGMPVWPTISRKHAKLAISACRGMPKRLQPLCRRFAWQQGITYLLENFCLKKWEIRPEHDSESVWFFERDVRRFKPFELEPWTIPGVESEDENYFYGFNICADIPVKKCSRTFMLEDSATVSYACEEVAGIAELSSTDDEGYSDEETEYASSVYYDVDDVAPSSLKLIPTTSADADSSKIVLESSTDDSDEDDSSDENSASIAKETRRTGTPADHRGNLPSKISYEKQEFIARSCCKQFLQQMVLRKKGECFRTAGRSAVHVKTLLSGFYQEHRDAYELMLADIMKISTPDQREIPHSDNPEWVAARILAINRAQNRLHISTFPPWTVMQRMWKVYGPLQQAAAVIGGDYQKFVKECVSVAYNQYYRLKNGIKVADEIPGDLLDLCYAITCERMREHIENVEALKRKYGNKSRKTKEWVKLKSREGPLPIPSQRSANAQLLSRCRKIYNEKRQTKRRRWNAMRYLHNALPGCVIEGIDVFDMAQRTNLSVAGMFGPEHKVKLMDMPFASDMDNRPAYLDMEELLAHMDHTLALQSGVTVDQEGKTQTSIDFLTVSGLQFKAVTGERGRCHLMVSPSAIPVPPVTIDRYGNMTSVERAFVPSSLYPELISRKVIKKEDNEQTVLEANLTSETGLPVTSTEYDCPVCAYTSADHADMDFAQTCFEGLSRELLAKVSVSEVCTENTTYNSSSIPITMSLEELVKLI
ncbi:unnamed protein product [Cylicocyclus nassatus]|uniref:Uncharacterized protein n=1 Tax=Cylicocyclus nassatus TaxID=53992 RepID=A0AA36H103_CYLNA|nr:unnamed protein product [Cylicocyclus nassatus]